MSTKKDLKTGAIFEVKLDRDSGYGYVKLLISHDIDPVDTFNLFIIKPYNVFSVNPAKKGGVDLKVFETDDILCFPAILYFRPTLKGQDSWRYVGMSELTNEDKVVPDYITVPPPFLGYDQVKDSLAHYGWISYVNGLKAKREQTTSFEAVQHLGMWPTTGSPCVNRFLTMHWRKEQGKDPLEFYRKYMDGKFHEKPEFEFIGAGMDILNRDNESFRKMEKVKRMKIVPR